MLLTLPDNFLFSQTAIQDYADCNRRFFLRYIKGQRYPAPESEPLQEFEERMEQGERFHHLIHQHQIGIPSRVLLDNLDDEDLARWFNTYIGSGLNNLSARRYPEIALTVPLADRRLIAKFDLLAFEPGGRALIIDWKTSPRRPTRDELAARWQTIIYPYVLAKAGAHLYEGVPIPPEQITMIYWFAEDPDQPELFVYSAEEFARADSRINDLVAELLARPNDENAFPLTSQEHHCKFCVYRSYTGRGTQAGDALTFSDVDDSETPALDFDQVGEIAF